MFTEKASLHNHTYFSDGIHSPRAVVRYAKKHGIRILSVTDHNEIRGTLRADKHAARYKDLIFFPGIELMFGIKGHIYELLAYFCDTQGLKEFYKEFRFKDDFVPTFDNAKEVVDLIEKYRGVVIVPHPFGRKGVFRKLRNRGLNVHGIEVINAFTGGKRNLKARRHEDKDSNFLKLGAADMHFFLWDMNKVYTEVSSEKEITRDDVWENLRGEKRTMTFKEKGEFFKPQKILFQKPLCGIIYTINHPFIYLNYKIQKSKIEYKKSQQQKHKRVDQTVK